jgi:hypothetical protein
LDSRRLFPSAIVGAAAMRENVLYLLYTSAFAVTTTEATMALFLGI